MRNVGAGTIELTHVSGTVKQAYLYWSGPINILPDTGSLLFNGQPVIGNNVGISGNNGWPGFLYSEAFRADVTALVHGNGSYTVSTFSPLATEVEGASLVVFFDDGNPANNRDVLLFDGNDSTSLSGFDRNGWNCFLSGINYTPGNTVSLQVHVSDGQDLFDGDLVLNGSIFVPSGPIFSGTSLPYPTAFTNSLVSPGVTTNFFSGFGGALWDIRTFDITSYLTPGLNNLQLTSWQRADCVSLIAVIVDQAPGVPPPVAPANNHPPSITGDSPLTVETQSGNAGSVVTLHVHVSDVDGNPLTVIWQVDNVTVRTDLVPSGGTNTAADLSLAHLLGLGNHLVSISVSDGWATPQTFNIHVTVIEERPPTLNCSVEVSTLWPPNHDLVNVGFSASAQNASGPVTVVVYSNEPDTTNVSGDKDKEEGDDSGKNFSPDAKDIGPITLRLRQERDGQNMNGRVYLIVTTAVNSVGTSSFCVATVGVPHDQSAASLAALAANSTSAVRYYSLNGQPPAGYVQVGAGPVIGPKQ